MSFTEQVRRKIEERREGRSAAVRAAEAAEARRRARTAPLVAAVSALADRLSRDPMFANAVGRPEVRLKPSPLGDDAVFVLLTGPAAELLFCIHEDSRITFEISPGRDVARALERGSDGYAGVRPIKGNLAHLDALLARAEDHIAEFLADVYLSPAAHVLEPERDRLGQGGRWGLP